MSSKKANKTKSPRRLLRALGLKAHRILLLPVPQVPAHVLHVLGRLPAHLLEGERGLRVARGHIARPPRAILERNFLARGLCHKSRKKLKLFTTVGT